MSEDKVEPKTEPSDQHEHTWLVRKAIANPAITMLVAMTILVYLPILAIGGYAVNCLADYLREDRVAQDAREEPRARVEEARRLYDDVNRRILAQTASSEDYDEARRLAAALDRLEDELHDAKQASPLPEFPNDLCGLIDIAPEEEEPDEEDPGPTDGPSTPVPSDGVGSSARDPDGR